MNFLAHLHLSGSSDKVLIGNFIGDFVKGHAIDNYEEEIARGVQLHRLIDEYTDSHEVVKKSKRRLSGKYRHYAGVIVDVFYDHMLASNWRKFSNERLDAFAEECYSTFQSYYEKLPPRVQWMLPYMIKNNWLVSYSSIKGIKITLEGMSRRTQFKSMMEEAHSELKLYYDSFRQEFLAFYPDLQDRAREFLEENNLPE